MPEKGGFGLRAHLHVANIGSVAAQQRAFTVLKVDDAYQTASQRICERNLTGGDLQHAARSRTAIQHSRKDFSAKVLTLEPRGERALPSFSVVTGCACIEQSGLCLSAPSQRKLT